MRPVYFISFTVFILVISATIVLGLIKTDLLPSYPISTLSEEAAHPAPEIKVIDPVLFMESKEAWSCPYYGSDTVVPVVDHEAKNVLTQAGP